jgi:ferric-dicitrate binding protein FerR (iron transport regulator)
MTGETRECEQLLAIDLARAEGREIAPSEIEAYESHLARCERCRAERRALDALADEDGPAEALDDIARRRYVDDVLARADEPLAAELPPGSRDRRATKPLVLGVAAALAAGVAIVLAVVLSGGESTNEGSEGADIQDEAGVTGRVVLVAGEGSAATSVAVGDRVAPGDRLGLGSGRTVMSLPTGITISLAPQSRARAQRLDDEALDLELERGELLVSATPGREGAPLRVITRSGTVTVTGTVFVVEDSEDEVEVRVIRGRVSVEDEAGAALRSVGPNEATVLGRKRVRHVDQEESADVWRVVAAFDLLDPGAGAVLDIRSVPSGAEVGIDGVSLGKTPVMAAVRAGHRKLELTLEGREPVRELVDVPDGETVSRLYDLHPVDQVVTVVADDAGTDEGRSGSETPSEGPAELLTRAQELRSAKDWTGAAEAYRELIRRFSGSSQASSALVSLAQIELDKLGKPGRALKRFDAYLSRHPGGPLALEALLGRALSLRAMGRVAEERAALEQFLERYPGALQAGEARRRLEAISTAEQG